MEDKKETSRITDSLKEDPSLLSILELMFNVLDRKTERILYGIKLILGSIVLAILVLLIYLI